MQYSICSTVVACAMQLLNHTLHAQSKTGSPGPRLRVTPTSALVDARVEISADGLRPRDTVEVSAAVRYSDSTYFVSRATFRADANGRVNLNNDAPLTGTYSGVDGMGMFWSALVSAKPSDFPTGAVRSWNPPEGYTVSFALVRDGKVVATARAERAFAAKGVRRVEVRENGLVGTLFLPPGAARRPAVVLLSGSEGGNASTSLTAAVLASHGYAALALAYFNAPGLPEELFQIPVEYVKRGVDWTASRRDVDAKRIALMGASKGGELALLAGSLFPEVATVVAYVAPAVVGAGITRSGGTRPVSSWTYRGVDVPYFKSDSAAPPDAYAQFGRPGPVYLRRIFEPAFRDTAAVSRAAIAVERINGGILIVTGDDDQMGTTVSRELIMGRLKAHNFPHEAVHLRYSDAGHHIGMPYTPTPPRINDGRFAGGGTAEGYARADSSSWDGVLQFLKRQLGP